VAPHSAGVHSPTTAPANGGQRACTYRRGVTHVPSNSKRGPYLGALQRGEGIAAMHGLELGAHYPHGTSCCLRTVLASNKAAECVPVKVPLPALSAKGDSRVVCHVSISCRTFPFPVLRNSMGSAAERWLTSRATGVAPLGAGANPAAATPTSSRATQLTALADDRTPSFPEARLHQRNVWEALRAEELLRGGRSRGVA
jgi:hypothetical protein